MDPKLEQAFNDQIRLEFASAFAYLQMAMWCDAQDLAGFATWMRAQYEEETAHALKFIDFVLERDGAVRLQPQDAPTAEFDSPLAVLEAALAHERTVTASISDLYALAGDLRDYTALPLLQWFLAEQVEEEATVRQIGAEVRMIGDDTSALLMLDRDLPRRRAEAEAAEAED